jgi:hypothetical protein
MVELLTIPAPALSTWPRGPSWRRIAPGCFCRCKNTTVARATGAPYRPYLGSPEEEITGQTINHFVCKRSASQQLPGDSPVPAGWYQPVRAVGREQPVCSRQRRQKVRSAGSGRCVIAHTPPVLDWQPSRGPQQHTPPSPRPVAWKTILPTHICYISDRGPPVRSACLWVIACRRRQSTELRLMLDTSRHGRPRLLVAFRSALAVRSAPD